MWVTGASSGIGEATAKLLAAQGAHLILSSRRGDKLDALIRSLPNPAQHTAIPLDLSDGARLRESLSQHQAALATVDVLINNAGISQRSLVIEAGEPSERMLMETNFFGAVAVAKAVLPAMVQRGSGRIVIMSSPAAKFGFPLRSSYAASKHALHGYFESLRAEISYTNVKISFVCPGRVQTDIAKHALKADGSPANATDERLARGITPEACARAVVKAAERGTAEVYLGREQVLIYLHRYAPWLFRWIVTRVKPD